MIQLKQKPGLIMELLSMCGCMNHKAMMRMFYNTAERNNCLSRTTKLHETVKRIKRREGKMEAGFCLTEKGRKSLLCDYDTTPNVSLYVIGNTPENCMEIKEDAVQKRGRKLGDLLVAFYLLGYGILYTEKPDYFEVGPEVVRRCRVLLEEMDVDAKNVSLRRINLEKIVQPAGDETELLSRVMYDLMSKKKCEKNVRIGGIKEEKRRENRKSCFFTAREIKTSARDIASLKMSRTMGVLVTEKKSYLVYYPGERSMRWNKQQELNMMIYVQEMLGQQMIYGKKESRLSKDRLNNLFIVKNYDVILNILLMRFKNNLKGDSFDDLRTYFSTLEDLVLVLDNDLRKRFSQKLVQKYKIEIKEKKLYYQGEKCYIGAIFQLQAARVMEEGRVVFCLRSQEKLYQYFKVTPIFVDEVLEETKRGCLNEVKEQGYEKYGRYL